MVQVYLERNMYTSNLAEGIYCLFEPHSIPVCIQVQLLGNYQTKKRVNAEVLTKTSIQITITVS